MEEGAKLFMRGIMQEMEPAMDDLRAFADTMEPAMCQFVREMGPALESLRERSEEMEPAIRDFVERMGPALADLMAEIGDLSAYHPPEILPNGDIIIRRKTPQEMEAAPPEGEVEI